MIRFQRFIVLVFAFRIQASSFSSKITYALTHSQAIILRFFSKKSLLFLIHLLVRGTAIIKFVRTLQEED